MNSMSKRAHLSKTRFLHIKTEGTKNLSFSRRLLVTHTVSSYLLHNIKNALFSFPSHPFPPLHATSPSLPTQPQILNKTRPVGSSRCVSFNGLDYHKVVDSWTHQIWGPRSPLLGNSSPFSMWGERNWEFWLHTLTKLYVKRQVPLKYIYDTPHTLLHTLPLSVHSLSLYLSLCLSHGGHRQGNA